MSYRITCRYCKGLEVCAENFEAIKLRFGESMVD